MPNLQELCLVSLFKQNFDNIELKRMCDPSSYNNSLGMLCEGNIRKEIDNYDSYDLKNKYEIISGFVQSGKTNTLLSYCWKTLFIYKKPVVMLLRNITADMYQLQFRIDMFNKKFINISKFNLKMIILNNVTDKQLNNYLKGNYIICALNNYRQVYRLNKIINCDFHLCIDEADCSIKSRKKISELEKVLIPLKKKALHIIGATATSFALLCGEKFANKVTSLTPPNNYKGFDHLIHHHIDIIKEDLYKPFPLNDETNIKKIYDTFMNKDFGIILHNVTRFKIYHKILYYYLAEQYPNCTIIIYNGNGIWVKCAQNKKRLLTFKRKYDKKRNVYKTYKLNKGNHIFNKYTINDVLQILKDDIEPHKHICIIAGDLASRGISFVSNDFKWHLTDQYFVPSKTAHGENIIQGMRILGCYNDDISLNIWCSTSLWKDIRDHHSVIQSYVSSCNNNNNKLIDNIQNKEIKIPKRNFTRSKILEGSSWKKLNKEKGIISFIDYEDSE